MIAAYEPTKAVIGSLIAVSTALVAVPANAQDTTSPAPEFETTNEIIVEGYTEKEVRQFLWRTLKETGDKIARRVEPVCFGIDNVLASVSDEIATRIRQNLEQANIPIGDEGCTVNASIVFHDDPHGFVNWLVDNRPIAFRAMYKPERRRLLRDVRPAYSWVFIPDQVETGRSGAGVGEQLVNQQIIASSAGALTSRIDQAPPPPISHSFTVVDRQKINGMSTTQLGDFLTLQIMIEFVPGEAKEVPSDSILNLFYTEDPELDAPDEMSRLDRSMLTAIYSDENPLSNAAAVRTSIAANMARRLNDEGLHQD
ncbi:hypothetical protein [uncultured Erythrobacter sp.]|uniref:hypothetical protein n=1 Tax=uncultured Erythrobacter sp. TaxID=263913 RepID=UPI00260DF3CE|nr:hypothetical protein [uncultured Erythrobacter sp.]